MPFRSFSLAGIVSKIIVVNAPAFVAGVWSWAKHLLFSSQKTKDMCEIVSSADTPEILRRYVHELVLPAYLGGGRKIHGDPECKLLLAPGGSIPTHVIERLKSAN